ncbi:hypothetical protein UFOVP393_69 [uncultured Caudovirales phage]|uniref:Uncharacterized protein n=1 Tax=uncultured Caudovirales phage TaxID=2100421 RepID=A0A6J7X1J2_9CAUD|nr:hypothetical protein UFOVP393_69 [uncultured Caudovirales phage]
MSIYLGNLSVKEIEHRAGVQFPAELHEYMTDKHQDSASNVAPGKWHCFDIPFVLVCGDMQTATTIHGHMLKLSEEFKQPLQIALQEGGAA